MQQKTMERGGLHKLGHALLAIYGFLVTVYVSFVVALLLLSLFLSEDVPVIGIVKSVLQLLLLPSVALLPLSLLIRHWRAAALLVLPVVGVVLLYGWSFIPRAETVGDEALAVLTFNLQAPDASAVTPLIEIIDASDADIVAVQELSFAAAEAFEAELEPEYQYLALYPQENAHHGMGVLSRYPIVSAKYWSEDALPPTLGHEQVEINRDGTMLTLYNTHPIPPYSIDRGFNARPHTQAVNDVLGHAEAETNPVILAGDFNMSDQFEDYERITDAGYVDTFREAGEVGFGFTFPAGNRIPLPPVLRLDYVFHDENFEGLRAEVLSLSGTSDHHPLLAHLRLLETDAD